MTDTTHVDNANELDGFSDMCVHRWLWDNFNSFFGLAVTHERHGYE